MQTTAQNNWSFSHHVISDMKASSFWSRLCLGRQASSSVMVDWTIGLVVEMVTLSFWKNRFSLLTMTMPRMPDNMCVMAMKANVCTWRNRPPATALFWRDASSPNSMMIAGHLWRSESTALWRESHQTEHGCIRLVKSSSLNTELSSFRHLLWVAEYW